MNTQLYLAGLIFAVIAGVLVSVGTDSWALGMALIVSLYTISLFISAGESK